MVQQRSAGRFKAVMLQLYVIVLTSKQRDALSEISLKE